MSLGFCPTGSFSAMVGRARLDPPPVAGVPELVEPAVLSVCEGPGLLLGLLKDRRPTTIGTASATATATISTPMRRQPGPRSALPGLSGAMPGGGGGGAPTTGSRRVAPGTLSGGSVAPQAS